MTNTLPAIELEVKRNFPWNFGVNLIDITFITLGLSLISRETIMPLLVSQLTDSNLAVGLIAAIYNLGFYLPQLLTASYTESLNKVKPFVMLLGGLGERLPYLLIALVLWLFAGSNPAIALILFFMLLAISAFATGVATPGWFTMIGKVLPANRRGIFFGVSEGLGALMGFIGATFFVGTILDEWAFPNNFAFLFVLTAIFIAISWVGLALNREPDSSVVKSHRPLRQYLPQLPYILRQNKNYRRFLIGYSLSKLGSMSIGLFIVFGNTNFSLTGNQVAMLTGILIGTQAMMNLVWGIIGDRFGHKSVLLGSAFAIAGAALFGWLATSMVGLSAAFILLGAGISGDNVSKFSIVLEFCAMGEQPTYIALTNTLLAPVVFLAPLIGGGLADSIGYRPMFAIAMVIALTGGFLLAYWVKEPRHIAPV